MAYGGMAPAISGAGNARMQKSGGLLVHKATHHFDMINWVIGSSRSLVSAFGQLIVYGKKKRRSTARAVRPAPISANALLLQLTDFDKTFYAEQERLRRLYQRITASSPRIRHLRHQAATVNTARGRDGLFAQRHDPLRRLAPGDQRLARPP
jgi:predicted dehydrogenase